MASLDSFDSLSSRPSETLRTASAGARQSEAQVFLGGYWLLAELARGQQCSVHRARSIVAAGDRAQVAIKRLRTGHRDGPARARLLREARLGLGLRSPNLVRVLELHDEPELFVVMEYVEGRTVRELLARARGAAALRHVLPMFVDALRGLSALHQWKDEEGAPGFLVHRAPSTSHMLAGVDGVTRLIDLSHAHGRSLATGAPGGEAQLSLLAPEQRAGRTDLDPRCDIFLVGSALCEALERACRAVVDTADETRLRAQCAPLRAIAERASAQRRSERFWSVDELAYQLQKSALEADLYASRAAVGAWVRSVLTPARPAQSLPRVNPRLLDATLTPAASSCSRPQSRAATSVESARLPELLLRAAGLPAVRGRASIPPPPPPPVVVARTSVPEPKRETYVRPVAAAPLTPRALPSVAKARESVQPVPARDSRAPLPNTLASVSTLHRVGSLAGAVALLAGAFVLGVRGFRDTPTASAARLMLGAPLALPARAGEHDAEPRPVVTSLAPPPRTRFGAPRDRALELPPPRLPSETSDGELIGDEGGESTIDTIAASIRVSGEQSQRSRHTKNLFTRPRLLRAELPGNPY